jgi:hypothetical protein
MRRYKKHYNKNSIILNGQWFCNFDPDTFRVELTNKNVDIDRGNFTGEFTQYQTAIQPKLKFKKID